MTQAKAKTNSVVTTEWSGDILTINVLGAGQNDLGQPQDRALMFDRTLAAQLCRDQAERHGWTQRICDRAAISKDPKTGKAARPADKFAAMEELVRHYESGKSEWRLAGSGAAAEGTLLFRALCNVRSTKTPDQVRAFLLSRTPDQMRVIRAVKEVIEEMNRLRLEEAGDQGTDEALGELDGME